MNVYLWMLIALVSFSLMAIGGRELSGDISVFQLLSYRSFIGLLIVSVLIFKLKKTAYFKTTLFHRHGLRNIFHFIGQYGWFLGIGLLPLTEVFALEFTVPLWVLLASAIFLKEKLTISKVTAVALGLIGVLVIIRPGLQIISPASLIVLVAALGYGLSHVVTKSLTQTDHVLSILFYMCLLQLPVVLFLALEHWVMPTGLQHFWLLVVAVTGLTANYSMGKAMLCAEVTKVVTIDFLRLPLIAIVGIVFYSEQFDIYLMIGGGLMLLGNLIQAKGVKGLLWQKK